MTEQFMTQFCLKREGRHGLPRCAQLLDAMLKNVFERVVILNSRNHVAWMNRYIENRDPQEVFGWHIDDLKHRMDKESAKLILNARKTGRIQQDIIYGFEGNPRKLKVVPIKNGWLVCLSIPQERKMLSPREREIIRLRKKHSIKEVSSILHISEHTVTTHLKNIKKKL